MKLASRGYRVSSTVCQHTAFRPPAAPSISSCTRHLHTTSPENATPLPHPVAPGPPPKPPQPAASLPDERIERRKRNAELLERGKSLRTDASKPGSALKKRFWKDVSVVETPEGFQIFLDKRSVRTPSKNVLTIPLSKPHLATAIALEWDLLTSAQQALKHHYIPLTSLTSRALDIATADEAGDRSVRENIVKMAMGYLTTDTLLCWNPEVNPHDPTQKANREAQQQAPGARSGVRADGKSLRKLQEEAAQPITAFLTEHIWPGVEIRPALQDDSIMPVQQPEMTTQVVRGWISGLPAWELAALERGCLASKSLCVATRLLVEWSGQYDQRAWTERQDANARFGIEEAAGACSVEVKYQTDMWGEVEDTHDVEKEDMRRQLGSAVILVHGEQRS